MLSEGTHHKIGFVMLCSDLDNLLACAIIQMNELFAPKVVCCF